MRLPIPILALLLAFLVSGCVTTETAVHPGHSVPEAYSAGPSIAPRAATGWLEDLSDPALEALVDEAMRYNNNLAASVARLKSARANVQLAGASRLPQVSVDSGASRRKSVVEVNDRAVDSHGTNYNIGANLSWEVDLWGRLLNRKRAAMADFEAASADHHGFKLSLAANVARSWYNASESELQLRLSRETVESLEKNIRFLERGVDLGTSQTLDLRLTRANLENARSNYEAQLAERDQTARALEVLLGRYPSNQIDVQQDLPGVRGSVPTGLPSALLLRRPDLIASERRLAATGERVAESKKDFLPSLNLSGNTGTSSDQLRRLVDAEFLAWSIAAGLFQPVYQGGRLTANLKRSEAQREEAMANFREAVLQAFREVETSLAAEAILARQVGSQEKAAAESDAAEALAWDQYSRGLVEGLTWLEAQRRAFNSKSALIRLQNRRLQNRIDLYLALGGDFKTRPTHPVN